MSETKYTITTEQVDGKTVATIHIPTNTISQKNSTQLIEDIKGIFPQVDSSIEEFVDFYRQFYAYLLKSSNVDGCIKLQFGDREPIVITPEKYYGDDEPKCPQTIAEIVAESGVDAAEVERALISGDLDCRGGMERSDLEDWIAKRRGREIIAAEKAARAAA